MAREIILVSGYIGSGKDSVGNFLVGNKYYKKYSIADSLKIQTATKYDFNLHLCYSQQGKNNKYVFLDGSTSTIRELLILEGSLERMINENVWIEKTIEKILEETGEDDKIVICDFRFPNEYKVFSETFQNCKTVRIVRDSVIVPDYESEHLLDNFEFDELVYNNGNLESLYYTLRYSQFF